MEPLEMVASRVRREMMQRMAVCPIDPEELDEAIEQEFVRSLKAWSDAGSRAFIHAHPIVAGKFLYYWHGTVSKRISLAWLAVRRAWWGWRYKRSLRGIRAEGASLSNNKEFMEIYEPLRTAAMMKRITARR